MSEVWKKIVFQQFHWCRKKGKMYELFQNQENRKELIFIRQEKPINK